MGVIAQEIERLFPDLVKAGADGYRRVDYSALAALAIAGVQEVHAELRRLSREVEQLGRHARATRTRR